MASNSAATSARKEGVGADVASGGAARVEEGSMVAKDTAVRPDPRTARVGRWASKSTI
ncbi:MAG: hypothetical protein WKG07_41130 [Hymenobacter sp.]